MNVEPAIKLSAPTARDSGLAPGERLPPLLTVTAPDTAPVPANVPPLLIVIAPGLEIVPSTCSLLPVLLTVIELAELILPPTGIDQVPPLTTAVPVWLSVPRTSRVPAPALVRFQGPAVSVRLLTLNLLLATVSVLFATDMFKFPRLRLSVPTNVGLPFGKAMLFDNTSAPPVVLSKKLLLPVNVSVLVPSAPALAIFRVLAV